MIDIGGLIKSAGEIIPNIINALQGKLPPQELAKIESELLKLESEVKAAQSSVLIAEIQGLSTVQRTWRPHLMYVIMFILINNLILIPWVHLFFPPAPILSMPSELWTLLTISLGGYIAGRTFEKTGGLQNVFTKSGKP